MAEPRILNIPAPVGGMDLVSAPDTIPNNCAAWMENFLPGQPGRVPVRRQHLWQTDNAHSKRGNRLVNVFDLAPQGQAYYPFVTRVDRDGLLPDRAPYDPPIMSSSLATGVSYRALNSDSQNLSAPIWGRVVPSGINNFAFTMDSGATTHDAGLVGPLQHVRPLVATSRHSYSPLVTPFSIADAPHTGVDLTIHLNRLFVLGGYPPNATSEGWSSSCLFFMESDLDANGEAATGTAADWMRDGVVNRINIPGEDDGVAIVPFNTSLIIFKRRSIWALYGTSPESFTLRRVTMDTGCYDQNSVVEADGGVYFMSDRGLQFFDGVAVTLCSEAVTPYFERGPHAEDVGVRCSSFLYGDEWLVVHMAVDVEGLYSTQTPVVMVMHRPTRSWTAFSGEDVVDADRYNEPLFAAGTRWVHGERVFWQSGRGRQTPPTREWRRKAAFRTLAPHARVIYKRRVLGAQASRAQLSRVFLHTKYEGAVNRATKWFLFRGLTSAQDEFPDPGDPAEHAIWAEEITGDAMTHAPTLVDAGPAVFRNGQHTVVDVHDEVDDVIFDVIFQPGTSLNATSLAEIYDGAIEYQVTHNRRTTRPRSVPN